MKTLIKNGKIIKKENQLIEVTLWLENGVIHAIGESFDEADFEQVFDAKGQLITPGLVDVHVHFREPGFTYKETIKTGSKGWRSRWFYYGLRNAQFESSTRYG